MKKLDISICHKSFNEIGYINLKHNKLLHNYTLPFLIDETDQKFLKNFKEKFTIRDSLGTM